MFGTIHCRLVKATLSFHERDLGFQQGDFGLGNFESGLKLLLFLIESGDYSDKRTDCNQKGGKRRRKRELRCCREKVFLLISFELNTLDRSTMPGYPLP